MDTLRDAENKIFDLRRNADLELQAGNIVAVQRIQSTIADLQKITGALHGAERKDNARTA